MSTTPDPSTSNSSANLAENLKPESSAPEFSAPESSAAETDKRSIVLGAVLITGGFLANTVQGALGKTAQETMAPGQFLWMLILIAIAVLLPVMYWSDNQENSIKSLADSVGKDTLPFLILRAIFGLCGFYLFIWAAGTGSLVDATVLLNTTPIFIPIIGVLLLGKHISWKLWLAIGIGFVGLLLIVQPDQTLLTNPANLLGVGAGLSAAIEFLTVRHLSWSQSPAQQTISYLLIGAFVMAPIALYQWQPIDIEQLKIVAAAAGSFLTFQLLLVKAYSLAEPHQIGAFQYSSVVFSAAIGWLFFNETVNQVTLVGIILISIGGVLSIYLESAPSGHIE